MMPRAAWRIACAAGSSGSVTSSGMPLSEPSRSGIVSGTLPSSGTSISSASSWPPPSPKSWKRSPDGVVKPDMFSITPPISSLTLSAIWAERRATFCAVGCGVVTITNFACGSSDASVIETSPVPGGRSISRWSSSPHATSSRNCVSALWSIGPRHTTASSSSRKKPIDMTFRPCASSGRILRSPLTFGRSAPRPSMRGIE